MPLLKKSAFEFRVNNFRMPKGFKVNHLKSLNLTANFFYEDEYEKFFKAFESLEELNFEFPSTASKFYLPQTLKILTLRIKVERQNIDYQRSLIDSLFELGQLERLSIFG